MQPIYTLICSAILMIASLTTVVLAMSKPFPQPPSFTVGCITTSLKNTVPTGLCGAFMVALTSAGMEPMAAPVGKKGDVTLVVTDVAASRLSARIDRGAVRGVELATTRKDAALDNAAFASFLNGLVAATVSLK